MAYQANKPEATDLLYNSQDDIQKNFESIKDAFDANHVTFDLGDEGKHKFVMLPEQVANPDPGANEAAIFSKESTVTSKTGLFWQKEEAAGPVPGAVIEMTASKVTGVIGNKKGYTMLPSGLKINFGRGTITSGNQAGAAIDFSKHFTTTCYACTFGLLGVQSGNSGADWIIYAAGLAADGFTPTRIKDNFHGSEVSFTYIAIGD